jgi:CBS domain-containing protein/sporulation protein YlmC with PRC-barrel domain
MQANDSASLSQGHYYHQFHYFSQLLKRPVFIEGRKKKLGKVDDLVFRLVDPFPDAVGIIVHHGGGKPDELIPWEKITAMGDEGIFYTPSEDGHPYPKFVDQSGWLLLNEHLMGRTILDIDGRRVEVVNDVHLLHTGGKLFIVHVDLSFNGFLRKWGIDRLLSMKENLIAWKYVQPLSMEDTGAKDSMTLSLTREQIKELPGEDLADALEELTGDEQQAVFSALDSEKAAEVLTEAEPRAQRQLIANLRKEKARSIITEMSVPQIVALFSVLSHDQMSSMMELVPKEEADKVRALLDQDEAVAQSVMSTDFVAVPEQTTAGELLSKLRASEYDEEAIPYIYIVSEHNRLVGVVDLREIVLSAPEMVLGELMSSPVVTVSDNEIAEEIADLFEKYNYHMLPVVDAEDHLIGIVHYDDIMKGLAERPN